MKRTKKLLSFSLLLLIFTLILNLPLVDMVNASMQRIRDDETNNKQIQYEKLKWDNFKMTRAYQEEMMNAFSDENIKNAMKRIDTQKVGIQEVQLSDNFVLTYEVKETKIKKSNVNLFKKADAATYYVLKTATTTGRNLYYMKVWDFIVEGEFLYDGYSVTPIGSNSYGHTYTWGWSCSSFSSRHYSITSTYAKAAGSGYYKCVVGGVTMQSFTQSDYVTCDRYGDD